MDSGKGISQTDDSYTSTNAVEVKGLSKSFDGKTFAVNNVSFTVSKGEIFGFLGPNGAGKSTTIKMLTTVVRPTSGNAVVCGYDVIKEPAMVRRVIGVVPQEYTADEDLTGRENLMLVAGLYGVPKSEALRRTEELLQLVELTDAANRKVITYSGGMRRRLELAAGLINRPQLLFLDEPTLGLDVQTRAAIWKYIVSLKEEFKMTIFLTTHYLEEADSLCNRIAIIDHGRIIKIGTPSQLKSEVGGDIIEVKVSGKADGLESVIASLPNVKDVKVSDSTFRIKAASGEETAPTVIDAVRSRGLTVSRISLTKPTLDEVYLELTGKSLREEQADPAAMMAQRRTMRMARS
ncbi:MAG: ATP-binding cassette domain-containing protein [Thermoprotei archaeon]